jgi:hypothetical protein
LPPDTPGHYQQSHPHPYYIPEKLPPSSRVEIDEDLTTTISDAMFRVGRIDGISPTVDFSPVLYTSLLRLEAVETAEIEGADVEVDEVYAYQARQKSGSSGRVSRDLQEVVNYPYLLAAFGGSLRQGLPASTTRFAGTGVVPAGSAVSTGVSSE